MSKAFETIEKFLEWEDLNFSTKKIGETTDAAFFGVRGYNQMGLLFMVENRAEVVQFRAIQLLDDEQIQKMKNNNEIHYKVMKFMLNKNAEYKLGKWTMDDDYDVYFTISQRCDPEEELDRGLLKLAKSMLFDDVDEMLSEIKKIIDNDDSSSIENGNASNNTDNDLAALMDMVKGI
jgi:hypothetical protein